MKHCNIAIATTLLLGSLSGALYAAKEDIPNSPYVRDNSGVYRLQGQRCEMIIGCFGGRYVKLPSADPKTFQVLAQQPVLAKDKQHVFYDDVLVPDADAATLQVFKAFDGGPYAKDRNNVYLRGSVFRGLDTASFEYLGGQVIKDKNAVYVIGASGPPIKAELMDSATMQIPQTHVYATSWQDANFTYVMAPGDRTAYRVRDVKTTDASFKRLGCNYLRFRGKIFYSVFEVEGADPTSFHVLPPSDGSDLDACTTEAIAEDAQGRYVNGHRLDLRNAKDRVTAKEVEASLYPEAAESGAVTRFAICDRIDNGPFHWRHTNPTARTGFKPAAVKITQYKDVLDAEVWSARGAWQPVPTIAGHMHTCDLIELMSLSDPRAARARERGDPSALTFHLPASDWDPIFVVVDEKADVKLAFAHRQLTRALRDALAHSRLTQRSARAGGMNLDWNVFLNRQGRPELWPTLYVRGSDEQKVEIGFEYVDGSLRCIDQNACSQWQVPQSTPTRFELPERRKGAA